MPIHLPIAPTHDFIPRMNALLTRARGGETGLTPEFEVLQTDYTAAIAGGWIDWEGDHDLHLRMLHRWILRAEQGKAGPYA